MPMTSYCLCTQATEGSPRRGLGDSTRDGDGGSGDGDLQSELAALNQQVRTNGTVVQSCCCTRRRQPMPALCTL